MLSLTATTFFQLVNFGEPHTRLGEWRWQRCIPMPLQRVPDRREWSCASAEETRRFWQYGRSRCCSTAVASRCSTGRGIWFLGWTIMLREIRARSSSWTPPASLFSPSAARYASGVMLFMVWFMNWFSVILILILILILNGGGDCRGWVWAIIGWCTMEKLRRIRGFGWGSI